MSINLFGKQNKHEAQKPAYPIPTTTTEIGGGYKVMVLKVNEGQGTIKVAWLDDTGANVREQDLSLTEYSKLTGDTTSQSDTVTTDTGKVLKEKVEDTAAPVETPKKKEEGRRKTSKKSEVGEVTKQVAPTTELQKIFSGGKEGFVIHKDQVFNTVDSKYNLVDITINAIHKSSKNKNITLDITFAASDGKEVTSMTLRQFVEIINKSNKNKVELQKIQKTQLTMRDKDGRLRILEKKQKEAATPVVTDEAINLEKALVYEERVNNAIATGDEESMALLLQEIFNAREKYEQQPQTAQLVKKLDELYRTLDDARVKTLETKDGKTPLGFSVGETISVFGTLYSVVSYDPAKKKFILENKATGATKEEPESSIKFAWSYPVKEDNVATTSPAVPEDSTDDADTEGVAREAALQELDKKIHQAEASIDMLEQSIAKDDEVLAQLRAELAEKQQEEKNRAGKEIFDNEVANARGEVLGTGVEGSNYYYDAKDGQGYTIRNYYRFDGTFDGNKTIAEPKKERETDFDSQFMDILKITANEVDTDGKKMAQMIAGDEYYTATRAEKILRNTIFKFGDIDSLPEHIKTQIKLFSITSSMQNPVLNILALEHDIKKTDFSNRLQVQTLQRKLSDVAASGNIYIKQFGQILISLQEVLSPKVMSAIAHVYKSEEYSKGIQWAFEQVNKEIQEKIKK